MVEIEFNCPENINKMPKSKNGRYCISCNKTIVDFSKMSNQEIAKQLARTNQKTCGIFKTSQVNNPNRSKLTTIFRMAFAAVFILGLNTNSLFAQDTIPNVVPICKDTSTIIQSSKEQYHIKGVITDADGETIPFTNVWTTINGIKYYAKSDINGIYLIEFSDYNNKPLDIWTKALGYDTTIVSKVIFPADNNVVEVNIVMTDLLLMKGAIVGIIYSCPPKLDKDPYSLSKTTITTDDLKHWIR